MSDSGSTRTRSGGKSRGGKLPLPGFFDLEGSDPELLSSGRIPDPQPGHTPLFRWMARVLNAIEVRLRARGASPVRGAIRFVWALIALVGVFLLVGPIINKPLDIDDVLASADFDEVEWVARDVELDYFVEREADGTFATQVSETLIAHFVNEASAPSIQRQVVTEFQGHDVEFALTSATIDGVAADVRIDRNPTITTIHLTPTNGVALNGQHEVTLEYELHNLIISKRDAANDELIDEWSWPLFASWPQATSGIEANFRLTHEVNDAVIRAPQAYIGWLLISETARLQPEETTAEWVRYSFSNDQNMPPNADFWVSISFEHDTFVIPPTTTLFWVQSWGPLLPLALLAVMLLFALAARRVVWADSAGDPWYVARSEPPDDLTPEMAAHLLRAPKHAELIHALRARPLRGASRSARARQARAKNAQGKGADRAAEDALHYEGHLEPTLPRRFAAWLRYLARVARRTGRVGNLPAVIAQRSRWRHGPEDPIIQRGLRWIPDSYLRDSFILAPIAISLVQWGLLRQLSHQVILTVVWWPTVFVLIATVISLAIIWAVWRPRPLTRAGALLVQQLKGIAAYARTTQLLARGTIDDRLLPYAVLSTDARDAGEAVLDLAIQESGDRNIGSDWKTRNFLTLPAIGALFAALAILAGCITWVSTHAAPYDIDRAQITRHNELTGTFYTQVRGFDISAELSRAENGQAELRVIEHHDVEFVGGASQVPQFAREWPASRFGQDLQLQDIAMRVDGEPAPFRQGYHDGANSTYVVTQFQNLLNGVYDVEVEYTLANAVVEARSDHGLVQQLRWSSLYWFWDDTYYVNWGDFFGDKAPVRPIRLEFVLSPDLVDEVIQGGWIDSEYRRDRERGESGNWFAPWQTQHVYSFGEDDERTSYEVRIGSHERRADGALVATLDIEAVESRLAEHDYDEVNTEPWRVSAEINALLEKYQFVGNHDLGVYLEFPKDTFTGTTDGAYKTYRQIAALPYAALLSLAGVVILASLGLIVLSVRGRGSPASMSLKLVSYAAIPIVALAQCVLFFWVVGPMAGDDGRIGMAMLLGGLMLVAVPAQAIMVARMRLRADS